jgi:serine/threonine protein kinase
MQEFSMIGSIINNKYRIEEELGRGGMGIVYKAYDTLLNRTVALKIMDPQLAQQPKLSQRFRGEAQILMTLEHPHIVRLYDLQMLASGFFIVMEFVEGLTLAQKINPAQDKTRPIRYEEALPIFKQSLQAIGYAHQKGILHRDLKPSNIMLTPPNGIKVMDFGLAKNPQEVDLTQSQDVFGTPVYMPPEQIKGLNKTDRRSDIYALGMTLYETLTGRWPFPAQENYFALVQVILNEEFPSPTRFNSAVPKALAKIVMKALAKKPERRFQTAEEMLAAIEQFEQRTMTIPAPPPPTQTIIPKPIQVPPKPKRFREHWGFMLTASAILLAVALGIYKFLGNLPLPSQTNPVAVTPSDSTKKSSAPPRLTHSPVIMEIAAITDAKTLRTKLRAYQQDMQIAAGEEKDFDSLESCYVFVYDEQNVLGVFQLQGNVYYGVNSTETYPRLPEQFSGKKAIWVKDYSVQ